MYSLITIFTIQAIALAAGGFCVLMIWRGQTNETE